MGLPWGSCCCAGTLALAMVVSGGAAFASSAGAAVRWFHSPSGNIECEVAGADARGTYAYCQTFTPMRSVKLSGDGTMRVCSGVRCLGNGPENATTLDYGGSIRVGPFRCVSRASGIRCVIVRSGHGFVISRQGLTGF
jgi:uncharacterized protein DUF6636